jgi:hypothetical protein
MKTKQLKTLIHWITERESIYQARLKHKPKPWTKDKILQKWRFCNVRRMDDKVSKWIMNNWYKPNYGHKNMLIACVLARHFNRPSTLQELGFPSKWQPVRLKRKLAHLTSLDQPVFNGAYIITGKNSNSPNKYSTVVDETTQQFVGNPPELNTNSIEECVNALIEYKNIGTFMAGQIVADLRWSIPGKWSDAKTWAVIGPGSRRGMNKLQGRDTNQPLKQEQFVEELREMMKKLLYDIPIPLTEKLEAIDYQNCLCEFDKYTRAISGDGRPKQKYQGV